MAALYNEHEPFAAEWLRNLISAGELPAGRVDERSITELTGADLEGIDELHLFAGIGGWPLALRLAGWTGPVWTGSCPCQPFSSAGKRRGTEDERHLWPEMFRLIRECRPVTVFGEQVAGKAALEWLDGVSADLEGEGYAVGSVVLGAHSVGAPHIRQRLFWVADSGRERRSGERLLLQQRRPQQARVEVTGCRTYGGLGNADSLGEGAIGSIRGGTGTDSAGSVDRLGDSNEPGPQGRRTGERADELSPWAASMVIPCRDSKYRRISAQPGDVPLAHGIPRDVGPSFAGLGTVGIRAARRNRVGRLRGYGNAVIPQLAAEFIRAFMEAGQ